MVAWIAACLFSGAAAAVDPDGYHASDDLGFRIALNGPAQRIVTLAPHATELVVAAGLGPRLVAVSPGSPTAGLPAELPRIGGPGPLDREALLALQPDLVVAWDSGNRPADIAWLGEAGIAVYRSEPRGLDDITHTLRALGRLGGDGTGAGHAADSFSASLDNPCSRLPLSTVYVEVWGRPRMSVGGRHWINAVLRRAGFRNRFEDVQLGVFAVTAEAEAASGGPLRISLIRRYDGSRADRLADVLSRPGPRLADAVALLCERRLGEGTANTGADAAPYQDQGRSSAIASSSSTVVRATPQP